MTVPLLPDQLDDFVNLTLKNCKRGSWVDLSLDFQEYVFASQMFQGKAKTPEKGGSHLNWKVQTTNTGTARSSELYDIDETAVVDLTAEAQVPWTKQTVNFSYDLDEKVMQSDRETIIKEIVVREHAMYNDFFELMEEFLWSAPDTDSVTPREPYGIPYWLVKNDTEGFNGGHYGSHSDTAGLDTNAYPNWKNYTFECTDVSRDDFIEKVLKACEFCKFRPPRSYKELGGPGQKVDWGFYTTYRLVRQLQKYLEGANENLGVDLAKYAGSTVLHGFPVIWVPYLEQNDSEDPFYGINWKTFQWFFRKGRNMVRQGPIPKFGQHRVRVVHMDNWGNFSNWNRRRNFVGHFNNGVS